METKKPIRVFVYPADLKFWLGNKSDKSVYRLYHNIQDRFHVERDRFLTIFHLRDYCHISLDDVISQLH